MALTPYVNRDGWIWQNGHFIPWREAKTHVINQGLHYASAVFEGERAYNGVIFKSKEHTERLFKSAEIMGIKIPFTHEDINKAKKELLVKMNLKNCYVRPIVWRGSAQMGLSTSKADKYVFPVPVAEIRIAFVFPFILNSCKFSKRFICNSVFIL